MRSSQGYIRIFGFSQSCKSASVVRKRVFVVTEEVVEYGDRWGGVRSPILKPWLEKVVGV